MHCYQQGDIIPENIKTKSVSGSKGSDMKVLKKFKRGAVCSQKSSDISGSKHWFLIRSLEDIGLFDATEIAPGMDLVKRVTHFSSSQCPDTWHPSCWHHCSNGTFTLHRRCQQYVNTLHLCGELPPVRPSPTPIIRGRKLPTHFHPFPDACTGTFVFLLR